MLAAAKQSLRHLLTEPVLTSALRPFSAPCVHDSLVRFFVIDKDGKRHQLQGLAGRSVAQAMHDSGIFQDFDAFTYSPDNPVPDAHVYVGREYAQELGNATPEEKVALDMCGEEVRQKCAAASAALASALQKYMTEIAHWSHFRRTASVEVGAQRFRLSLKQQSCTMMCTMLAALQATSTPDAQPCVSLPYSTRKRHKLKHLWLQFAHGSVSQARPDHGRPCGGAGAQFATVVAWQASQRSWVVSVALQHRTMQMALACSRCAAHSRCSATLCPCAHTLLQPHITCSPLVRQGAVHG